MVTYEEMKIEREEEKKRLDDLFAEFKAEFPYLYKNTEKVNFEVPKGWVGLVKVLSKILESNGEKCVQVKSKLGCLRFYTDSNYEGHEDTFETIRVFENASITVCENCSNAGTLNTDVSFIQTLCKKCVIIRDDKWKT